MALTLPCNNCRDASHANCNEDCLSWAEYLRYEVLTPAMALRLEASDPYDEDEGVIRFSTGRWDMEYGEW